tara:strand:+ start:332 stop:829 length:498 start_codon:yes stop_codon:yes gene_type:complete
MNYLKGIIFLTTLLVLSRIIPHPPNFTPILAGIIFLPFIKKDIKFSVFVPLGAMLISDFIIGMHSLMLWTYGPIIVLSLLSYYFSNDKASRIASLAIASPAIFYLMSNFGVWINSSMYTKDFSGFIQCYINAIPFYANSATACVLFCSAFFVIKSFLKNNRLSFN